MKAVQLTLQLLRKIQAGVDGGVKLMDQLRVVCIEVHRDYHGETEGWTVCSRWSCKSSCDLILKIEKDLLADE